MNHQAELDLRSSRLDGTLVHRDDGATPSDPDGNKVCLCTWQGRT